jgi:acyl-CoA ligase (AMP-forming) (exosortase A-associated)
MDCLISHMLRTSALHAGDKEALVAGSRRMTYAEVNDRCSGLAAGLLQTGLNVRDRIAIHLDHSIPLAISIFGVSRSGCAFVPISNLLMADQVQHIVRDCSARGLITSRSKLRNLAAAIQACPSLEFVIATGEGESPELNLPVYDLDQFCETKPKKGLPDRGIDRDLAAILYTSGSTGKPKGVMLNHAQVMAGASIVSDYLSISSSDRILSILPFSFDAGLNQIMAAFQQGSTLVMMSFIFAKEIVQMLLKERITGLAGVPTLWSVLAQSNSTLAQNSFPDLRYITNTGGAMPQAVLAVLRKALPATKVFLMYGLTEAFRSTYLPPEELDRRPTSMGKAIPNTEILVVNDQGKPCKPGEEGILVHRGPTVSMGYWGHPELTSQILRPHPFLPAELGDGEKVCYSGDLVKTDEDGFLYFIGRRDNMIKSSGMRISPTEVEEVIFQSGKVSSCAVIGVADSILGQRIKAFITPKEGDSFDADFIIASCSERLPRHMVPKEVEIIEEMPKMSNGKIDYQSLRLRQTP